MGRVYVACCLVLAAVGGCGGRSYDRFTPSEPAARQALETALAAWLNGQAPGPVEGTSPLVRMVDGHRRAGQTLQRYDILGPAPGDGPRVFAVRVTLAAPAEEKRLRFVVFGIDPLWVVRYEDYEMLAHWDHPMGDERGKQAGRK